MGGTLATRGWRTQIAGSLNLSKRRFMKYRFLADTGVAVSSLAFGTLAFGGEADESMSRQMFDRARAAGINLFDTANVYQKGRSEEILGNCIQDCRDEVLVASKAYY